MKYLPLIWACLWRRPARALLTILAAACAFTLYSLAVGIVAGVTRMAAAAHVETGPGLLMAAAGVSAIGFALILFLTANATAQSVRLRLVEFGMMKAIGFTNRLIILLVAAETTLPWLAGAMLGLGAAWPLLPRLVAILPFPPGFPGMTYTPAILAGAFLLAILLGVAGAGLPTLRIIRLEVAEALTGGLGGGGAPVHMAKSSAAGSATVSATAPGAIVWQHIPKANPHLARQIAVMTRMGFATLRQRWKGALAVVVALMILTLVMNPLLILMDSFKAMMAIQGNSMNVMVTQRGGLTWRDGRIPHAWTDAIRHLPGIARAADGRPIAEARFFLNACEHPDGKPGARGTCIGLDGLEAAGAILRPPPSLLAGRLNRPGTRELIMSANNAALHNVKVGTRLHLQNQDWVITGIFESKSFWVQGNTYGDATVIRAAGGQGYDSFVLARLASPADLEGFRKAVQARFGLDVDREDDFYNHFASRVTRGWRIVFYVVGVLFGVGAGAGIFHIMLVTVEARGTEMAVLRAIGFSASAVAASVVLEAMFLAATGALLGMLILWLWLDGAIYRGSLTIAVAWGRVAMAVGWALGVALLGALSPALGAVRVEVAEALRR